MEDYQAILQVFDQHQSFALSTHINPDGDALGAELALYSFLKDLGKQVKIVNTDATPRIYQFLPFCDEILTPDAYQGDSPEILVVLDAGMLNRIGEDLSRTLIPIKATVNIDHHATADLFGDYNLVEVEAASTSEIIYRLIRQHGSPIGKERALCLYTGVMFDTGCFRYSNSTPAAHRVAADLIEEDISVDEVYRLVYETVPIGTVHLLGEVLKTIGIAPDGKIAWLCATQEMFRKTGTTREDVDGFINHIRSIDSVEVAILVSELEDGKSKASLRSKSFIDVGEIVAEFGGGGHQRAAGCEIEAPCDEAIAQLVESTQRRLSNPKSV
ncbi:MAG: bifunctional oligoribonuclease/PAP phosphatase NrnA [Candidatus Poribacteria bacterium]|nr:bifunctional oligoribonuclease/PAP phosphatase NrnA [Candidatus Poribacteria bacterium]